MAPTYTRLGQATGELRYAREWISRVPSCAATVRTTDPHTGNACIEVGSLSGSGFGFAIPTGVHTRLGAYFQYPSIQAVNDSLLLYFTVAGENTYSHGVHFDYINSILSLIVDEVTVDTATFAECGFTPDIWLQIGYNFKPNEWLHFYAGGTPVLSYNGTMTATSVNGAFFGDYSIVGNQNGYYLDDVYIDQCNEEVAPSIPPRKIFMAVSVASNGMYSQWTPSGVAQNYQAIDDPTAPDDDTTHNYSATDGQRDTFNMTSFTMPTAGEGFFWRIAAVLAQAVARRVNVADDAALTLILYDGLNTASGVPHTDLGPDYLAFWDRFDREPDHSSWSESDVQGIELGYVR